jgi:neopullulanase
MSDMKTPDWVKDTVFYQIFPDRFAQSARVSKPARLQPWGDPPQSHLFQGGDLLGVVEHLDHLVDLGIGAIYFCPVFQSTSNHRYHTYDYFQVDPLLGGNAALEALIQEAHARGIKLVLDGVFNHASRGFFQFNDILENGPDSPYLDWFHARSFPLRPYGPPDQPPGYDCWWGNRALPKFNTATPEVREFLWGVAEHWIRLGIDGWRLDVPNEIDDDEFWREFRRRVKAINPDAYIVGEIWERADRWLAGDQFDAVMNYPLARAILGFTAADSLDPAVISGTGYGAIPPLSGENFAEQLLDQLDWYPDEAGQAQLNLLGSHDTPRFRTVAKGDESAYRLATLLQMTLPGAPCIYYGDEVGMEGGKDPDCRRAFPWHTPTAWNLESYALTKRLIQVRSKEITLRRGATEVILARGELLAYRRALGERQAYVVVNASRQNTSADLRGLQPGNYLECLSGQQIALSEEATFAVGARSGLLLVPLS